MDSCCEAKASELAAIRFRQGHVLRVVLAVNAEQTATSKVG